MSEKPPLTDKEVYDLLHLLWLHAASAKGSTEYGENTLRAARVALFALQSAMVMRDEAKEDRTPSPPSEHSD